MDSQPTVPNHAARVNDSNAQETLRVQAVRPPESQATLPNQAVRVPAPQPIYAPMPPQPAPLPPRIMLRKKRTRWPLYLGAGALSLTVCGVMAAALMFVIVLNAGVMSGVSVAGVKLGGLSESEAAVRLRERLDTLTLRDPQSGASWTVSPSDIGVTVDSEASAARAYAQGRTQNDLLTAMRGVSLAPVLRVDTVAARAGFESLRGTLETPALNAGVAFVNGQVSERPAQNGRVLDIEAAINALTSADAFRDGTLALPMQDIAPSVTRADGLVEAARALLASPFVIRAYDPVTGDSVLWQALPQEWAAWLTGEADPSSANGLRLTMDRAQAESFLAVQAQVFDSTRYLDMGKALESMQAALDRGLTSATVRVYHHDRTHTVQAGETIISIAWDYGVPYPWVQAANGGVEAVSIGQTITIPSPDNFFPNEPVPNKRIVVSISRQRVWVYENDALKWEWVTSTGISDSPTWPGVYQIISHVPNAYAANWNLYMPYFMGVYQPIPNADFTNGFHGFPTRGGGQILWENSLGTRVTYGCILLSNVNAAQLYEWAQEGVIVEIQR